MSRFWSKSVKQLSPYVPGEQPQIEGLVKLNTNENPYPPSPKAIAAMQAAINADLRRYPDPESLVLKQAIADNFDLTSEQVFVGNGSDEVLAHIFCGLLKQDKPLLFPDISYGFYPVYCQLYDIEFETIALTDEFAIDPADYSRDCGGIIFPNPNAPTGRALSLAEVETIVKAQPDVVVVVDEAYVDFGAESAVSLVNQYPNLLVVQTLSKSRSLAGLRVGYAMGQAELIEALERVKNSFNSFPLDRIAVAGAVAALKDKDYFEECCTKVISTREAMVTELTQCGFEVIPSAANFVFARLPGYSAEQLGSALRQRKVLVRYFNKPRIDQFLRITIGTDQEQQVLITALDQILSGN